MYAAGVMAVRLGAEVGASEFLGAWGVALESMVECLVMRGTLAAWMWEAGTIDRWTDAGRVAGAANDLHEEAGVAPERLHGQAVGAQKCLERWVGASHGTQPSSGGSSGYARR